MPGEIWRQGVGEFADALAAREPSPAGVAAAAIAGALGASLIVKVAVIRSLPQHAVAVAIVYELRAAADADAQAVQSRDPIAMQEAPLHAARAAVRGVQLCAEAKANVHGLIAADLDAAGILLTASARAVLACIEANLQRSPDAAIAAECAVLTAALVNAAH